MRTILALDTSSDGCSVALNADGEVTALFDIAPREHTRKLLPMVKRLLTQVEVSLTEIDAIAFGCGPGAFTGLRIAAGVAQGLAYGSDLPVIEISTLDALALQSVEKVQGGLSPHPLEWYAAVAVDARMSEVYWSLYQVSIRDCPPGRLDRVSLTRLSGPSVTSPESVPVDESFFDSLSGSKTGQSCPLIAMGDGWKNYRDSLQCRLRQPVDAIFSDTVARAAEIACLAYSQQGQNSSKAPEKASPVYLRDEVTWKKLPGR
ncbi:MAG: tRNA (adenosine(37)-N6)-threonylcarbamoyltransferase complex dimerization subunit type 1 TsaB [Proteobacteria bacterium]|nr:MAG: tRNA (adenosine(37)-N6)-threonylcarbamoyltransferase complex dimerization subunit type 1 TsaB [Pseudomonadota bacterium]PIE40418.1 MAG: tRNA (adenosine(37)-N6)-threonylcarbamoyltransferase complex dimerization subunit type 1 TsaB [Gammaproteobacteria bacterium]